MIHFNHSKMCMYMNPTKISKILWRSSLPKMLSHPRACPFVISWCPWIAKVGTSIRRREARSRSWRFFEWFIWKYVWKNIEKDMWKMSWGTYLGSYDDIFFLWKIRGKYREKKTSGCWPQSPPRSARGIAQTSLPWCSMRCQLGEISAGAGSSSQEKLKVWSLWLESRWPQHLISPEMNGDQTDQR